MEALNTLGVRSLYICLFFLSFLWVQPSYSAKPVKCHLFYHGSYFLPAAKFTNLEAQESNESRWLTNQVLQNPIKLDRRNGPIGLRLETPSHGTFLVLNLSRVQELAPNSLEWQISQEFQKVFIPKLYYHNRKKLGLSEIEIDQISKTSNDPDFISKTILIINVENSSEKGPIKIRGGMGIQVVNIATDKLPLQKDLETLLPDFNLNFSPEYKLRYSKSAEVIRTGIDDQIQDPRLFGTLVQLIKGVLIQDEQIGHYYFHTPLGHLEKYNRKLRSLELVVQFKRRDNSEVIVRVERKNVLAELGL
jgi:hypothetical protein